MKFTKTFVVVLLSFPLLTAPAFADRDRGGSNQRASPVQQRAQAQSQQRQAPSSNDRGRQFYDNYRYRPGAQAEGSDRPSQAAPQRQQPRIMERPPARRATQQSQPPRAAAQQPPPLRVADRQQPRAPQQQFPSSRDGEGGRRIYNEHYKPAYEAQKEQRSGGSQQRDNDRGHGGYNGHDGHGGNDWHGGNNGRGGNDWRGGHSGHGGHNNYWRGDIHHFRHYDYPYWRRGYWNRGWYGNRFGWWWVVGPSWYGYSAPVYPYPNPYIPPVVLRETVTVVDNQAEEPDYWYYCENPEGYYPYVKECAEWFRVPAEPEMPPAPYEENR